MNDGYIIIPYSRTRAIDYARKWALERNPIFEDYTGIGGDCTNFVSQCVYAGTCVQNFTPDFGWYFISPTDRAPSWTGVEYFYDFMTNAPDYARANGGIGPFARSVGRRGAVPGDVVQLADEAGDFYHTLFISDIQNDEIYVCAHSDDALDRPLSSYNYRAERFIHILGARAAASYPCFEELMGEA